MEDPTDTTPPSKKTMFDFILWYNDIELKEVEEASGVSYTTLFDLKVGKPRNFTYRTLRTIAKSLNIDLSEFYDWDNKKHKFYGEEDASTDEV